MPARTKCILGSASVSKNNAWLKLFIIQIGLIFLTASTSVASHTKAQWTSKFDTIAASLGTPSSDLGSLGSGDAYVLRAYLNMYEATGDTKYLDSFVSRMNTINGYLNDFNGDGYLGWQTPLYSVNLAQNGGAEDISPDQPAEVLDSIINEYFETPSSSDPTLPDGWVRDGSTSATTYLDVINPYAGVYSLTVKNNVPTGWEGIYVPLTYEPGALYRVGFMGKVSSTAAGGDVSIYNQTDNVVIARKSFYNLDWAENAFYFNAPATSGKTLWVLVESTNWQVPDFTVECDNLKVEKVVGNLLPDKWERWQSTPTTAFRDTTNKTAGNAGFTIQTNPTYGWQVLRTSMQNLLVNDNQNYEPGIKYQVTFKAKFEGATNEGRFAIYDYTASQYLYCKYFTNTAYQTFTDTFVTPSEPGHDVKVELYHQYWDRVGTAYFDEISIKQFAEYVVDEEMLAIPMAKFIKMVRSGKTPASYSTNADTYLSLLENHLIPKWDSCWRDIDANSSTYVIPDDGSFYQPNNSLPHNQYLAMATTYALLGQALDGTAGATYRSKAGKLCKALKDKLRSVSGNAYEWNYWDKLLPADYIESGVEDTSHGCLDIEAAINAHLTGAAFYSTDMQYFANTFVSKIWDGNTSTPHFGSYVNTSVGNSGVLWAWMQLAAYDARAYDMPELYFDALWNSLGTSNMEAISEIVKGISVIDESFENPSASDSTLPDGWVRDGSTSATTYLDETNPYKGKYSLTVKNNVPTGWEIIRVPLVYEPGASYTVRFMGKVNSTSAGGNVAIYNQTDNVVIERKLFYNLDWGTEQSFSFTAPSVSGKTVWVTVYSTNWQVPDFTVYCDNLSVRREHQ